MQISIIGAGKIGGSLGRVWASQGHQIIYGSRNPTTPELQTLVATSGNQVRAATVEEALAEGEVVVFAIPGNAMAATVTQHAAALGGKTVIDTTNLIGPHGASSAVPLLVEQAPQAQVFRAFNSVGFENIEQPRYGAVEADMFFCGPDSAARQTVSTLISEVGFRPIYIGDNSLVYIVDALAALWLTLALRRGMGRRLAFKLLSADE